MENYRLRDLSIEITHNCPLNCVHCSTFNGGANPRLRLDSEKIIEIAKQALPLGLESVSLSGGEPCTHPELINIVRNLKSLGIRVSLYSCGVVHDYLSRPVPLSRAFLESLRAGGLDRIIFNFQSARSKIHEAITQVTGSYGCVIKSIENSLALKIQTELHTVPMRQNLQSLPDTIDCAKAMGLSRLSLLRFVPQGRGLIDCTTKLPSPSEYKDLTEIVKKANGFLRLGSPFNFLNHHRKVPCTAGLDKLVIRGDGKVIPCEAFKQSRIDLGNVKNHHLEQVWKGGGIISFRNLLVNFCTSCKSGCLGQELIKDSLIDPANPSIYELSEAKII